MGVFNSTNLILSDENTSFHLFLNFGLVSSSMLAI